MSSQAMPPVTGSGDGAARLDQPGPDKGFNSGVVRRQPERRADPVLGALIDVAIAYRDNLGSGVAEAFMRETGVSEALARRVLDRSARQRTVVPRRRPLC